MRYAPLFQERDAIDCCGRINSLGQHCRRRLHRVVSHLANVEDVGGKDYSAIDVSQHPKNGFR